MVLLVGSVSGSPPASGQRETRAVASDEQGFALDLLRRLGPVSPDLVLSPSGISTLLAMLEPGAAGATQAGIARALQSSGLAPAHQAQGWHALTTALSRRAAAGHVSLESANQTWLQLGFPVRSSYLHLLAEDFAAGLQEQDIHAQPAKAAAAINDWVSRKTHGHITKLVTAGELKDAVAVLVDAVYLDAPWAMAFDKSLTELAPFHVSPTATKKVPMMSTQEVTVLAASASPSLDAVELPYRGRQFSALVLMPPLGRLANFEERLTPRRLDQILGMLRTQPVHLELPRFSLRSSLQLNQVLSSMGMSQAFSPTADFANLSPRALQLAFVVHSAQMKVSEQGTEASAGSAGGLVPTAEPYSLAMVVDHPFLFLVRDDASGCILFEAQVTSP
jgi:serpin B